MRDLQFVQALDYPRIKVDIDRERAGFANINVMDASNSLIAGTFSSRYVLPIFWADPQDRHRLPGAGRSAARTSELDQRSRHDPREAARPMAGRCSLRDIAKIRRENMPEEYDRLNQLRYVSMTANIDDEDLGRVSDQIDKAIEAAKLYQMTENRINKLKQPAGNYDRLMWKVGLHKGISKDMENKLKTIKDKQFNNEKDFLDQVAKVLTPDEFAHWKDRIAAAAYGPPRGVKVEVRGQVLPMHQMFEGLAVGLGLAVVMVMLLLTAYFQSVRLAIVATATAPMVVAGVALALYVTGTTLNIESFMGAIMAIGVAVANAILLVTFAERNRQTGMTSAEAAITGASERLRPILMTSCAMIVGMVPMALGLGDGGDQTAPLGRAVIGGLLAATAGTTLILPHIFAIVLGKSRAGSPSLHPLDKESIHYDPTDGADTAGLGEHGAHRGEHPPAASHEPDAGGDSHRPPSEDTGSH